MRLSVEETLRNLKQVEEKYKIRFTPTGEVNISEMARNCIDTIEALQQENEQLQAQVARVGEALQKAREAIKAAWGNGSVNAAMDKASEALAEIDKAIGGKEDV